VLYNAFGMSAISQIKPQRNNKRVNIYLDGKFGFGIDLENFVKLGLKVNQELTDEEVKKIVKKAEFQKTLDKLLRFATLRPRSEKEIGDYLKRKKVHESIHKELFNKLTRLSLVNDMEFTRWWIEQRNAFKPKGKKALMNELRGKGIDKETARMVLAEFDINEKKIAGALVLRNAFKWEKYDFKTAGRKKAEFLARQGFSWEVIKEILSVDDD